MLLQLVATLLLQETRNRRCCNTGAQNFNATMTVYQLLAGYSVAFQSRNVRHGVEDKIWERECKALLEADGSAASQTSIHGEMKTTKDQLVGLITKMPL